jgi:hypothetical protein
LKVNESTIHFDLALPAEGSASAGMFVNLSGTSPGVDGVDLIAHYQGFLDRSTVLQVFVVRLGYRLRS